MADPRYVPRSYCDEPELFGLSWDLHFRPLIVQELDAPLTDNQRTDLIADVAYALASRLQHEYAVAIRHILQVRGLTYGDYTNLVGGSRRRQEGVLRGESVMRSDDFERADQALGGVHLLVRVYRRRANLREVQAILAEYERDARPWPKVA